MAATNAVYPAIKTAWLQADVDMLVDTLKAYLYRGYTYDSTDAFLSDINAAATGGAAVATSAALSSKTVTSGVFDAADVTFTAVAAGVACDTIILAKDTGSAATSNVITCFQSATGLPVTPNGTDIPVTWDNGANKILALN